LSRFGVALPQSFCRRPDTGGDLKTFLQNVEAAGFDSLWTQEQLLGGDPSLEPLTSLAYAAASTSRLRLGTATVVAPLRDPILLAKTAATIDVMSGGRLILGLSIGEVASIYRAVGVSLSERGRRIDEMVEVLSSLWTKPVASHHGRFWDFVDAQMEPKPMQPPHPEIWFGGHSRAALKRVASSGSGWIGAGGSSIEDFGVRVGWLGEELEAAGRSLSDVTVAKKLYIAVDEDPDLARAGLENWFKAHWPPNFNAVEMARTVGVAGNAEMVAAAIGATSELGADLVILNPVFDEDVQVEGLIGVLHDYHLMEEGSSV
jgi:probable F420-dependent oxidoreductase